MKNFFTPLCDPVFSRRLAETKRETFKISGLLALILIFAAIAYRFISMDYPRFGFPRHGIGMLAWVWLESFVVAIVAVFSFIFAFSEPYSNGNED